MAFSLTQVELDKALFLASCRIGGFLGCLATDTIVGADKVKRDQDEKEITLFSGVIDALGRYEVDGTANCLTEDQAQKFIERLTIYTGFCIDDLQTDVDAETHFILTEDGGFLLQEDSGKLKYK